MKFLVPTDFSENAFHAAVYALTLAKEKPGSSIHLLNVVTPILNEPMLIPDIEQEAFQSAEKIIKELNARCSTCDIDHSIRFGETATEISNAAEELNAGMIIMGMRGIGKTGRLLFGSNTLSLINKSSRPVFVIPETSAYDVPRKIVFATDYYDSDLEALQHLFPIATAFNSEIVVTHVFEDKDDEKSEQSMMDFISGEISKKIDYPRISYRIYRSEGIASGIQEFCESAKADLVVVSARKRKLFEKIFQKSVTKELSYTSAIPLLVCHTHKVWEPIVL